MNLRKNKGYVGMDASIAVLILLLIIPTITGMIYNINKTNNSIERKTEAINISINIIEAIKGIGIEELNKANADIEITTALVNMYSDLNTEEKEVTTTGGLNIKELILTKNQNTYKIEINVKDYAQTTEGQGAQSGYVKIATIKVIYRVGQKDENIELSTVIS